jgi:predicted transcriptional regulator
MTKKTDHPLKKWLDGRRVSVPQFADKTGIPFRTLYDTIAGIKWPNLDTMLAIQAGTDDEVSVQTQANWFRKQK